MKHKYPLLLFFFLTTALFSQEMKLFAPFPSRIKTEKSGTDIIISWKDAKDVTEGIYEIYRAGSALTADNLYLAEKVGEAAMGTETYTDTPPRNEDVYYAVFIRDNTQVYKICIPFRNVTTTADSIKDSDIEETKSTTISNLTVTAEDTEVSLLLQSSLHDRSVLFFRSTSIIDTYEKLEKSINIGDKKGSDISFSDTPMGGINYYYAAVDSELYSSGSVNLLYDGNYTTDSVQVKFSHEVEDSSQYTISSMPLPLLKVSADLESGEILSKRRLADPVNTISIENIEAVQKLIKYNSSLIYRPADAVTLAYNRQINPFVSSLFLNKKWEETIEKLEEYTSLIYDEETRTQSHFYRGQSYYYLGMYNKALLEFIMVEQKLYVETKPFFKAIYHSLRASAN